MPERPDTIEPVKFEPSVEAGPQSKLRPWHWVAIAITLIVVFIFWFLFTSKSVQLHFTPAADDITVAGGISFELGGVYLLREGDYEVSATKALHHPLEDSLTVGGERNQRHDFVFTPLPGILRLDVLPADAVVSLEGTQFPVSAPLDLEAGEQVLTIDHPRFIAETVRVVVEGKRIEQTLSLELQPDWAEVEVTTSPPGAAVYIDGVDQNVTTPATVQALSGEREIEVRLEGYKRAQQRIFAQAGVGQVLPALSLVQADARVSVTSSPEGAGVTLNGQFMGQTPIDLDVRSGVSHRVDVIYNGFQNYSRRISLSRGDSREIHANLIRELGEIRVVSDPPTARLAINGRPAGLANTTVKLPIEPQDIAITLDGHAGFSQTITPRVGLTQEIKVRLLTHEEARLRALTPTVTTAQGQVLRLLKPFEFSMGASRREPGRRANETLREVAMSRLFYLGIQEVTNAEFRRFASGHDSSTFVEASLNEDDMPVANISWHDAAAYCNWLSDQDDLPPFYEMEFGKVTGMNLKSTGYRLPTEAEWSWTARTSGDEPGGEQFRFPWGGALPPPDRHGNYADRAASTLVGRVIFGYNDNQPVAAPVGTFRADARGFYDIGGNVAEWVNDYYEIPGKDRVEDPWGPDTGEYHVIKGSSWMHGTITELRYSFRDYGIDGRDDVGFRIARSAE